MITVIDNYDSFTYNLVQQIERLAGERVRVVRNDAFEPAALVAERPRAIVISPGPGTPARAGRIIDLIRANDSIPLLGVCLGHQAIGQAFGSRVVRAKRVMHGKTSRIRHDGAGVFAGIENHFVATRYHSLAVERATLPECLKITAQSEDGEIMGLRHQHLAVGRQRSLAVGRREDFIEVFQAPAITERLGDTRTAEVA